MTDIRYDAFISYKRGNGFLMARVIYNRLKDQGIQCFFDLEELDPESLMRKFLL